MVLVVVEVEHGLDEVSEEHEGVLCGQNRNKKESSLKSLGFH